MTSSKVYKGFLGGFIMETRGQVPLLEILIERNPGDAPKSLSIARTLRGAGSHPDQANFEQMFKPYFFGGNRHYGTKADVINLSRFFTYLDGEFGIGPNVYPLVVQRPVLKHLLGKTGYLTCFWDKPSEIHHRDVMRFCFGEVAKGLEDYSRQDPESKRAHPSEFEEKLILAQLTLVGALDELAEAKVSASTELGVMARKIIELSQGYVFYSEDPENTAELWKSRVYKIKLESKITKDQRKLGAMPSSEETLGNLNNLLACLEDVDLKTNRIFLPECHVVPVHYVVAHSKEASRDPKRRASPVPVQLKVHYEPPNSHVLDY